MRLADYQLFPIVSMGLLVSAVVLYVLIGAFQRGKNLPGRGSNDDNDE